jgi:hypothetical protein
MKVAGRKADITLRRNTRVRVRSRRNGSPIRSAPNCRTESRTISRLGLFLGRAFIIGLIFVLLKTSGRRVKALVPRDKERAHLIQLGLFKALLQVGIASSVDVTYRLRKTGFYLVL